MRRTDSQTRIKQFVLRAAAGIPPVYRWGPVYRTTQKMISRTEKMSAEEMQLMQARELQSVLQYCLANVPVYRDMGEKLNNAPLTEWPLVSKEQLSRNAKNHLTDDGHMRRRAWLVSTGGSSGSPFLFYLQKGFSEQRERAFLLDMWARVGFRWDSRVARFRGDVLPRRVIDRRGVYHWQANRFGFATNLVFSGFHLAEEHLQSYVDALKKHRIEFLHAYFSSAHQLAKYILETNQANGFSLRAALCGSENLYPGQKNDIERAFGCRMFSWYGHSERCVLGAECEESEYYHIYPQYGVFELVDAQNHSIRTTGRRGTIVGTSFNNYVMPFVRYQTDDTAEYASLEGCPRCGRPYPTICSVVGRSQEHLLTADGSLVSYTAINWHEDLLGHVRQYQFVQDSPGRVALHIVPKEGLCDDDMKRLHEDLRAKLGERTHISIHIVDRVELSPRGKFQFIVQRLDLSTPPPVETRLHA